jgi:ribose transport system permease protein
MEMLAAQRANRIFRGILDNIVWIILVLLVVIFSSTIDGFFSIRNYINIIYHSVFIGMLAIAESYCLISGNLDLSIESVAGFGAIFSAWLCGTSPFASGLNVNSFVGLLIIISIGALVGLINGFFILRLRIHSFLVTLSTYIIVRGLAVLLTGGKGVSQLPYSFRLVDTIRLFNMPLMVYIMLIFYIFFYFILENTRFGKHLFVIGGNINAAYNFGINVNRVLFRVFILSGIISGFTGWLMAARANGATPAIASGFLFEVLAAVVIGGVSLVGGVGSLVGVFAGVLILSSLHSALNILAISPFITEVVRGGLVLVAIVLDSVKRMFR